MSLIDQIAEQKIVQAMERGELDELPGAGKPLTLDDDRLVPEHLRVAYRLLRNAGYLPPEIQALREIRDTKDLLARAANAEEHARVSRRLRLLELRLVEGRGQGLNPSLVEAYRDKIYDRLEGKHKDREPDP